MTITYDNAIDGKQLINEHIEDEDSLRTRQELRVFRHDLPGAGKPGYSTAGGLYSADIDDNTFEAYITVPYGVFTGNTLIDGSIGLTGHAPDNIDQDALEILEDYSHCFDDVIERNTTKYLQPADSDRKTDTVLARIDIPNDYDDEILEATADAIATTLNELEDLYDDLDNGSLESVDFHVTTMDDK